MIYHVFSSEKADDSYEIGGAEGIYTHPEPNKEHLIIYGPLMEDVTLYVSTYREILQEANLHGSELVWWRPLTLSQNWLQFPLIGLLTPLSACHRGSPQSLIYNATAADHHYK